MSNREKFESAIAGLPNSRRAEAWEAYKALDASVQELLVAAKAVLNVDNPPAGEPGHVDYGTAVGMVSLAIAKAESASR